MNALEVIKLNFVETRRRSILLWSAIPNAYQNWKPDSEAMSVIQMIRHVLEGEHLFHKIILNRGNLGNYNSPWHELPYEDIKSEIKFTQPYRESFLSMIDSLSENDLNTIKIERSEVGQSKLLGDYLNRMVYHEAVHTGQLLDYMRTMGIKRPLIWD